jgi:hypothetical protein
MEVSMPQVSENSHLEAQEVKKRDFHPRSPLFLTLIALALGISVEVLFNGHPLGISFPIWAALCVAAIFGMTALERARPARQIMVLAVPILVFAFLVFLRLEPMTVFLNVVLTLTLFTLWVHAFANERLLDYGWLDFLAALTLVPLESWIRPWSVIRDAKQQVLGEERNRSQLTSILWGLLMALPILVIFTALLSAADLVFADYVNTALHWLNFDRIREWVGRGLIILISAMFFLGALALALLNSGKRDLAKKEKPPFKPFLGVTEAWVVLGSVDLLFVSFVAIQFAYLFGGQANITAMGYTYSEYARRGFGELVAVAFLTLGLILTFSIWTSRENRHQRTWFNVLSTILVALIVVILSSALMRLMLYERAYGFTRLRTYTHMAILWMAILFAAFLVLLLTQQLRRFPIALVIVAMGFTLTLNILNVDAFIVRQNAKTLTSHYDINELDAYYLSTLSDDAVPELVRLAEIAPEDERSELLSQLACRRSLLTARSLQVGWQSFHLSHTKAQHLLDGMQDQLAKYRVRQERIFFEGHGYLPGDWMVSGPEGEVYCLQQR